MSYVFESMDRWSIADRLLGDSYAGWSVTAARALADWLLDVAEATDEPIEFDLVAIRCDFSEYSAEELVNDHWDLLEDPSDWDAQEADELSDELIDAVVSALRERTEVWNLNSCYIVRAY